MTKFQAITNKIWILPDQAETKKGSIYLPESGKERKTTGKVVSIGEQVHSVKVGDRIMFHKWEVTEAKVDNILYFIIEDKQEHLIAIVED